MNASIPELPPDPAQRAAEVAEFLAKLAGSLGVVWVFIARVGKPFIDWRQKRFVEAIRSALKEELDCIAELPKREAETDALLKVALERQDQVFDELDLFMVVVADNRERLNEINALLDEVYSSRDRRVHGERAQLADSALAELQGKLRSRRRREGDVKNPEGPPS